MWTLGEDFTDLPLVNMRVVDMSLDRDGVCQSLLQHLLAIERPEFESRNHSLTKDVLRLHRELAHEQVQHFLCYCYFCLLRLASCFYTLGIVHFFLCFRFAVFFVGIVGCL